MATTLQKHISGKITSRTQALSVPEKHMLRTSRDSMRYACAALGILGGPNHYQAAHNIEHLTGQIVGIDTDCTCIA